MKMKSIQPRLRAAAALVGLAASLSACAPVLVGGAFIGGAMVVTDRRTSGTQLEDEGIELRAQSRLRAQLGESGHINVTSYNRQVLLTGEVPSAQDKEAAAQTVAKVENVRTVVNELGVMANTSLGDRSGDALITGRAKAALVDARDLQANAFKLLTERSVVYMLGRVTEREARRATEIVRTTQGVHRVVRLLEYITEDELKQLQPPPEPAQKP